MAFSSTNRPFGGARARAPGASPEESSESSSGSNARGAALAARIARRRAREARGTAAASSRKGSAAAVTATAAFPITVVLKILVFLAVTGLIGYGAMSMRGHEDDPHYLQAKKILRDYELGKDPATLNYEDPAYPEALSELAVVDPGSISARPASDLANDINARIVKFRERINAEKARVERDKAAEAARNAAVFRAQMYTTGVDSDAAARTTARSKLECLEDQHPRPSPKR